MNVGIVGKKCGMTRVFTETGEAIPVTVIEALPNFVTQVKTTETDGYTAIQIAAGAPKKTSRVSKPLAGHFAKAGVEALPTVREFRASAEFIASKKAGDAIDVNLFTAGQFVDVRGVSKGKGFAGVIKRHNFRTQDATHGNSLSHRAAGSTGQNQTPGRVFKGKKMAGQMGNVNKCVQNLQVVRVDAERNLILVSGAVPGAPGGTVVITPAVKKPQAETKGSE